MNATFYLKSSSNELKQASIEQLLQYEAIQLFVERATAIKRDFKLTYQNAQGSGRNLQSDGRYSFSD